MDDGVLILYPIADILPVKGLKALTYLATSPDKQVVLSLLCSLVNAVSDFDALFLKICKC
jgi:hypothetical protein